MAHSNSKIGYFICFLAFLGVFCKLAPQVRAQEQSLDKCRATTRAVVDEIGGFGTPVYLRLDNSANNNRTDNPTDRQQYLSIVLGNLRAEPGVYTLAYPFESNNPRKVDQTASNILNSLALQQKWSNALAKNCPDLAIVNYGFANSDWILEYAIQENGTMRKRDCVDYDADPKLINWNTRGCL